MESASSLREGQRTTNPPSSCVKHTFLFVNETTEKAGQKIGRRRDIKSHVRNHIVERERRNRKNSSAINIPKTCDPELVIDFAEEDGLRQDFFNLQSNPESDFGGRIRKQTTSAHSSTLFTGWPAKLTPELKQLYIEHGALPRDVFNESVSVKREERHVIQEVHKAYCVACGATQGGNTAGHMRDLDNGKFNTAAKEAVRRQLIRPKPRTVLGCGRSDPFSSYPSMVDDPNGSLHELMDHSVSYLLPGLLADGSRTEVSAVSKAWMCSALQSPLLFHALVFAGSIHLDFLRSSEIHPNAPVALSHKLAVIQQLNKVLSDPVERARDEIILAILILSSHEVMDLSESQNSPFQSPLKSMQWLNVYGNIRNVDEHLKAVMDLVTLRGGVESLELYGLAEILIGGDVVAATISLSKPAFSPLKRSLKWVDHVIAWAKSPPRLPIICSAFETYREYGITTEMVSLFEAISALTVGIDHYLRGEPRGLSLSAIARTRIACQQQLLALPQFTEIRYGVLNKPSVYEAVRMTAFIYGIAVLLPIPRTYKVLQEILQRQRLAIEVAGIELYGNGLSELLVWMLVLGGVAALDKPEKAWYIAKLVSLVQKINIDTWGKLEHIVGNFLWLNSACSTGGRRLWGMMKERSSFLDTNRWLNPPQSKLSNV